MNLLHLKEFIPSEEAWWLYGVCKNNLPFHEQIWGPTGNPLKRLVCNYDPIVGGIEEIDRVVTKVRDDLNFQATDIFCNWYRNGLDETPYHSDNYDDLTVVSFSMGATRDMFFKPIKSQFPAGNIPERQTYSLENGDLIVFGPEINQNWQHSIPARKRLEDGRINLTMFCKNLNGR